MLFILTSSLIGNIFFAGENGYSNGDVMGLISAGPFNRWPTFMRGPRSRKVVNDISVTVHGFPIPSSPCLVCVRVRMCEQVSVGVCD